LILSNPRAIVEILSEQQVFKSFQKGNYQKSFLQWEAVVLIDNGYHQAPNDENQKV